jgi:hypothetical protein
MMSLRRIFKNRFQSKEDRLLLKKQEQLSTAWLILSKGTQEDSNPSNKDQQLREARILYLLEIL